MQALLVTLGERDVLSAGGVERVAARAGLCPSEVEPVGQLAQRALDRDPALAGVFGAGGPGVVGCSRPRAVRALLAFAGVQLSDGLAWLALPFEREALRTGYGVPWYPVIDRARCTGCGTCHDYCLFSVYAREAARPAGARVRVEAPLNCKTGCPACSRLCPEGALIFPFCAEAELNGEIEEPARRTPEALAAALGDDPMRVLAERRKEKRLIDPSKFD